MRNIKNIIITLLVILCISSTTAFAAENVDFGNVGNITSQTIEDGSEWIVVNPGENGRGIIVLKEGRVILLKKDVIIDEEFCKQSSQFGDDNETLYVKIRGSNIPGC